MYSVEKQTINYQKIRKKMNKLGNTVPPIYISLNHNIVQFCEALKNFTRADSSQIAREKACNY